MDDEAARRGAAARAAKPSVAAGAGPVATRIGLLAVLLLAGCGQKGPLYMDPGAPPHASSAAAPPASAAAR